MRRRTSPVQQWVDSIPSPMKPTFVLTNEHRGESSEQAAVPPSPTSPKDIPFSVGAKPPTMTVSAPVNVPNASVINTSGLPSSLPHKLVRDPSLQSDSSHCSSVESLLELRKADPEAILLGLGFGGCPNSPQKSGSLSRIPKRFLQPSKLKGIAINDFMKQQQETSESFDSVSLGYRGLTGSPYVAPSEIVQKIMQRLREHENHEHDPYAMYNSYEQYSTFQHNGTLSVLSPDNRQFLERPRSKSPDMRNKRMIIGQKSFAFGHDGDLIEINSSDGKESSTNNVSDDSDTVGNSAVSKNFEAAHEEIPEEAASGMLAGLLPKRLSFNDSMRLCDTNVNLSMETGKENYPSETEDRRVDENADYKESIALSVTSPVVLDIRRASDGCCDVKFEEILSTSEGRRHSDSFVHAVEECSNGSTLSQRRKTLKRQTRITDVDTIDHYDSKICIPDTTQYKECSSRDNIEEACGEGRTSFQTRSNQCTKESTESKNGNESCGAKCSRMLSKEMHNCIQSVESSLSKEKRQRVKGKYRTEKNEPLEQVSTDEEKTVSCCCRRSGTKKYLEKIMQENKNLENMVSKNRSEMAEIREMLNSVLSVRLEPGF